MRRYIVGFGILALMISGRVSAQPPAPPAPKEPLLRLEAGGPTSFVSATAMSADGKTLYAAGFDQVVRVWKLNNQGEWTLDPFAFRVPIGPGVRGAINTLALSADGQWLAAAGNGFAAAGIKQIGFVVPVVTFRSLFLDIGVIHVWNTKDRTVRVLRGHAGAVLGLTFGPNREGKAPLLLSAAQDRNFEKSQFFGGLRLWDPSAEKPDVAQAELPPPTASGRVGLSLWATGDGPKQLRAAIGWGDQKYRRWDVDSGNIEAWDDGKSNEPLAAFPDRPKFLTTNTLNGKSTLRLWTRDAADIPAGISVFPDGHLPRAIGIISAAGDGKPDYLAAVTEGPRDEKGEVAYQLQIVNLDDASTVRTQLLWRLPFAERSVPNLATAVGGKYLAVAGNNSHEIHLFLIADLLKGPTKPIVRRSVGAVYRFAAFVENGKSRGVVLSDAGKTAGQAPRDPKDGDTIFDLTDRKLTGTLTGWKLSTPDLGGWTATVTPVMVANGPAKSAIVIRNGNDEKATVTLAPGEIVTDFALTAPGKPYVNPILVVATERLLQPSLRLYDAFTGAQFTVCTAHTDVIRSVAFSADGKSLVTTADDQTVNVWSLADLSHLGKRGLLTGLAVKEGDNKLQWARPEAPADIFPPNTAALTEKAVVANDELEGIVENGVLKKFTKLSPYFDAVSRYEPGKTVTLRTAQRGDVTLTVGQAIMEIKPLFTLFITRDGKAEERDWIGWNPNGPYEYSDRKAERWIGWHFNPAKLDTAATFDSPAEQYHKEFYREGILHLLLANGAVAPALQEWDKEDLAKPLPKPVMQPWMQGIAPDAPRVARAVLLREPPKSLRIMIGNFPAEKIASLQWSIADGPRQAFSQGDGLERTVDLSTLAWKRGPATIKVYLKTRAAEPQEYVEELPLQFQFPPPALPEIPAKELRRVVDQEKFGLNLMITPSDGRAAKISFKHVFNEQEVPNAEAKELAAVGAVTPTFTLKQGLNRIEVTAVNADAAAADTQWETSRVAFLVDYQPKPIPRIDLDTIVPVLDKAGTQIGEAIPLPAELTASVSRPVVRLRGVISADEELSEGRWSAADDPGRELSSFNAGKKEIAFQQAFQLKPGANMIQIFAKAKSGGESSRKLTIHFRPELPRVEISQPAQGRFFYDTGNPVEVPVLAQIVVADEPRPYRVVMLVNGKPIGEPEIPAAGTEELKYTVKLAPGVNRLEMRATNEWGAERTSEPISVRVLRPPMAKAGDAPAETEKPLVNLSAVVKSYFQLDRDGIEVLVNDKPTPVAVEVRGPAGANSEWTIRLTDVPLNVGANTVQMWARNSDARSRQAAEWKIAYTPPMKVIAPPQVEISDPPADLRVTDAKLPVRLRVISAEPLTRVELRRDGGNPVRIDLDLRNVAPDAQGVYDLKTEVDLIPGPNPLRAIAVNAGGQRDALRVASFLQEPVELIIEKLVSKGMESAPLFPKLNADGHLILDQPLAGGRVTLFGKVYWAREDDEQFKIAKQVRVFVNGFQQKPAELRPFRGIKVRNRPEREFVIDLLLNRTTANHVEIVLPGLKQRSANRREFLADCAAPERIKRLHVLPVVIRNKGDAAEDEAKLVEKLHELVPSAANATLKLYPPLTKYVSPNQVLTQLINIKAFLDATATDGGASDLVVVYYQGGEVIGTDGHFLLTSVSAHNPNMQSSAVSCGFLSEIFEETLGAQILLLDLTRQPGKGDKLNDVIAQWPDQPNVSIFRYSRLSATAPQLLADVAKEMGNAQLLGDVSQHLKEKYVWKSDEWSWAVPGADGTRANWRVPANLGELKVK